MLTEMSVFKTFALGGCRALLPCCSSYVSFSGLLTKSMNNSLRMKALSRHVLLIDNDPYMKSLKK